MSEPLGSKLLRRPTAVYIVSALGFLFFGLMGHDFPPYLYIGTGLALLCFFQAYYQNVAVWWGVLILYALGAAFYGWVLIEDLILLARHGHGRIFLDFDDSVVYVAFVALLFAVTIWLLNSRPRPNRHGSDV
jgi:hypothetical protein